MYGHLLLVQEIDPSVFGVGIHKGNIVIKS